ncbi:MAG TPA: hypothetical protein VHE09_02290, partial [Rhizomicrobium sp.]|nr:hypothetical protein [Rhizomicrobium sp.]
ALFVAACLPVTTKYPVGTTAGFKQDPDLVGVWKAEPQKNDQDDKQGFLAFLNAGEEGAMTGIMIAPGKGTGDWGVYNLKLSTLGRNHFMNAWAVANNGKAAEKDEAQADVLLLYRINKNGKLSLYLLDEDKARTAVKSGRIKGDVGQGSMGDVRITADPVVLDKFFGSSDGAALFDKPFAVLDRAN